MLLVEQFSSYSFNSALSYFAEASPLDISDFHSYIYFPDSMYMNIIN